MCRTNSPERSAGTRRPGPRTVSGTGSARGAGRAIVRSMETSDNATAPESAPGSTPGSAPAPVSGSGSAEPTGIAAQDWATASADPRYRAAVVDLLGALAYGELAAFERLAEDAKLAPTLDDKAELAKMASAEFHHFERLRDRLGEIDADPTGAMDPFAAALDDFHRQTAPSDWLEGLVKAYVGDSIASDFYREVAARLDTDTRGLVLAVLDDTGHGNFAVEKVRAATELVAERAPELALAGPIQYDAAIDPTVGRAKMPDSEVAGHATVFVFPDLNTGNNTYKAVQRSAGAVAIGPILQGLRKPINDLSRGALVGDIVNTVAITAIQAGTQAAAAAVTRTEGASS